MGKKNLGFMPNLIRGFKGLATNIVAGIVTIALFWLTKWIISKQDMFALGVFVGIGAILLNLIVWGYFAYKFWNWK